jgi:hypothetical protein
MARHTVDNAHGQGGRDVLIGGNGGRGVECELLSLGDGECARANTVVHGDSEVSINGATRSNEHAALFVGADVVVVVKGLDHHDGGIAGNWIGAGAMAT